MRILVVGAGGVGSAVAPIAARRSFFEAMVVADYDAGRAEAVVARVGGPAVRRRPGRRLEWPTTSRPWSATGASPTSSTRSTRASSCRSSTARSRPAPTTSTWRCRSAGPHPDRPYELTGEKLGDEQFAMADDVGDAPGGSPSSGSGSSRACRTSSPATRPTTCSARSTSSGCATARTSSSTATTSRRRSASGRRSRSASTRR